MNPKYDIASNAKINKPTVFDGTSSSKEVVNSLNKLLKDEKNKEYQDQIYFALANVYYTEGNEEDAIDCYEKSIATSTSNSQQKAISYLSIGEIYYGYRKYIQAQPYLDSCMKFLPENYRNYHEIKTKSENLNILANNVHSVEYEDSVQRIANMSPHERNLYIDKIIDKIRQDEETKRQQDENANMADSSTLTELLYSLPIQIRPTLHPFPSTTEFVARVDDRETIEMLESNS